MLNWYRRRGVLHRTILGPVAFQAPPRPADPAMRVTPIGLTLEVASDRAPAALHLMSLVATGTEALITVVMRMRWPADGSSSDLEVTGAGAHHLPYDQFWAVDDEGTRYTARFEGGYGETAAWRGVIQLSPVPPRRARWLDLIGDGTRLLHLPLHPAAPGRPPVPPPAEPTAILPADRLLTLEAERILATGDARGPAEGPDPGEIITVLTEVGAIAAWNPLPGQLGALCHCLGASGHGITVPLAAHIRPVGQPPRAPGRAGVGRCPRAVRSAGRGPAGRRRGVVRPGRAEFGRGREPPARGERRPAAARGPVRVQLDAGLLLVAHRRRRELARGDGR